MAHRTGPQTASLVELFDAVSQRHGQRVAVEVPAGPGRSARRTTYAQLRAWAEALAAALPGDAPEEALVAILLGRESPALYAAQLGVLKAGLAFTCVDPSFPADHLRRIIDDAAPAALLSDAAGCRRLAGMGFGAIDVDAPPAAARAVERRSGANALAYVIYTSGSTGRPKGVMIEQGGIANLVRSDVEHFGLSCEDRVAQCSSPAYDSSIEETWLAFSAGATLVPLDDATVRLGPDLVPWLRRQRITVVCPPPTLLRSTGCADPQAQLPDLRLLYVGGEVLPRELADLWAAGRWMENGYGPTECTITVTRGRVRPGREITIGRPVPGHTAHVLDEALREVPAGEPGELCIAGPGLARGYRGLDELTRQKFPTHERFGRIYRTGDLVRLRPDGDLEYLGRSDGQVKLRGYRIELAAVEAELSRIPGIRAAGCRVQGEGAAALLAAHIVRESAAPDAEMIRATLRAVLPSYMVPARIAAIAELPTTAGGKLDRRALPEIAAAQRVASEVAMSQEQRRIADAFAGALGLSGPPGLADDFFLDLGGDSLSAVGVICELRKAGADAVATVRDLYEARTVAAMAERLRSGPSAPPRPAPEQRLRGTPGACTLAQAALLLVMLAAAGGLGAWLVRDALPGILDRLGLLGSLVLAPIAGIVALLVHAVASVAVAALAKRLLIGRYQPGRFPVWGGFYLRHWIVVSLARLIPWWLMEGTVLTSLPLRALGARVGRRVTIQRGVDLARGGWDLLEIGADVTLARDAELRTVDLEDGQLVIGPVRLGDGATLDVRAGMSPGSRIEPGGQLTPLSWLAPHATVGAEEQWDGVPARRAGAAPPRPQPTRGGAMSPARHATLTLALRCGRMLAAGLVPALLVLVLTSAEAGRQAAEWLDRATASPGAIPLLLALTTLWLPLWLILQGLTLRLLPTIRPGVISRWSAEAILVHFKSGVLESAGRWLSGAIFWPWWLRLAGMGVGRGCEISTIIDVVPELVHVADECFFADGIYFCSPWQHRGTVTLAATQLGPRTFLGNHAVVPAGPNWPEDFFVGVSTVADPRAARAGSAWFGHPAMELPRRQVLAADRRLTHNPGPVRYVNRLFWEALRFTLPALPLLVAYAWLALLARADALRPAAQHLLIAPLLSLAASACLALAVAALKWLLLGRVKPGEHPLWSCWCSRWDFLYVAWGVWARGIVARLDGTLLLNAYLRLFGMRIGRRVVLGPGFAQVVDPDMLDFADDATVTCHFQAHSFEDRILKIDRVRVGRGATLGDNAVVFYRVSIGDNAHVLPHGVVMKGDALPEGQSFAGCPATRSTLSSSSSSVRGGDRLPWNFRPPTARI